MCVVNCTLKKFFILIFTAWIWNKNVYVLKHVKKMRREEDFLETVIRYSQKLSGRPVEMKLGMYVKRNYP